MQHARLTHVAHELWSQVLRPGDTAVDATAGNGHDTLFRAQAVGPAGTIYAFDMQASAIAATQQALDAGLQQGAAPALHLLHESHAAMGQRVAPGSARLVCFNLGFLPGSDKALATQVGDDAWVCVAAVGSSSWLE